MLQKKKSKFAIHVKLSIQNIQSMGYKPPDLVLHWKSCIFTLAK